MTRVSRLYIPPKFPIAPLPLAGRVQIPPIMFKIASCVFSNYVAGLQNTI